MSKGAGDTHARKPSEPESKGFGQLSILVGCTVFCFAAVSSTELGEQFKKWMPTWREFIDEMNKPTTIERRGVPADIAIFDAFEWTQWTREHWLIPLVTATVYIVAIPAIKLIMAKREAIRAQNVVCLWNFLLSIFSFTGLCFTFPKLFSKIWMEGFEASVCSAPQDYGHGYGGFFVMAFIYSKLAEVVDTFFLLIRKNDVILLHWYHHATVMLFCWQAYAVNTGFAGLWFATMNYFVHSVMYFYYALTQYDKEIRKKIKKVAIFLTSFQIAQMVMGLVVLVKSVVYQMEGRECYLNKSNQLLGLLMYISYFLLFVKLFIEHYVLKPASTSVDESKKRA